MPPMQRIPRPFLLRIPCQAGELCKLKEPDRADYTLIIKIEGNQVPIEHLIDAGGGQEFHYSRPSMENAESPCCKMGVF